MERKAKNETDHEHLELYDMSSRTQKPTSDIQFPGNSMEFETVAGRTNSAAATTSAQETSANLHYASSVTPIATVSPRIKIR